MTSEIKIANQADDGEYVIAVDGTRAGFLAYQIGSGRISLLHAEIDPDLEGRGLGSQLVAFALDDARSRGLGVLPFCPFVNDHIKRHPAEAELVAPEDRGRFGLAGA